MENPVNASIYWPSRDFAIFRENKITDKQANIFTKTRRARPFPARRDGHSLADKKVAAAIVPAYDAAFGLAARPWSNLGRGFSPRRFFVLGVALSVLSIFVDESGDFGEYEPHSPLYLMTLVFHDQSRDISEQVEHLKRQVIAAGFAREHAIHSGPLIRREKDYERLDLPERRRLFRRLFDFARLCDISYRTFGFRKRDFKSHDALVSRMSRELGRFVRDRLAFFQSFDNIIVYYDNGQKEITTIINGCSTCLSMRKSAR